MTEHYCHAEGCMIPVAPKLLMCRYHWRMVPRHLQLKVWEHYRPFQEVDRNPSGKYLKWAQRAIDEVARKEQLDLG